MEAGGWCAGAGIKEPTMCQLLHLILFISNRKEKYDKENQMNPRLRAKTFLEGWSRKKNNLRPSVKILNLIFECKSDFCISCF